MRLLPGNERTRGTNSHQGSQRLEPVRVRKGGMNTVTDRGSQRIALVTGASRGIGAEAARFLAADGDHVIINYREKHRRAQALVDTITRSGGAASSMGADLSEESAADRLLAEVDEQFGKL